MEPALKRTVFYPWHKAQGAHMISFGGWEMPLNYSPGILEEHLAVRKFGGLFDISHMGRFRISGPNALPFLQYVLTNNAAALEPWQAQYTLIPNEQGGAIDDAYLYRMDNDQYLLVVNAANTKKDWMWLKENGKKFPRAILEDCTEEIAMAALQGPHSKAVLQGVLTKKDGSKLPDPGRNNLCEARIEGFPFILSRTGYTGEPLAFEFFMPAGQAQHVWEQIMEGGRAHGILAVGLGARDTLRLEADLPLYGHELGVDFEGEEIPILALPPAKIAVSFAVIKGNYIGREALFKQFEEIKLREEERTDRLSGLPQVPRRIWPLVVQSEGVVRRNFPVYKEDRLVGYVTSGTMVPYWKFEGDGISSSITHEKGRRAIALAYLDADLKEEELVQILSRGKPLSAKLVRRFLGAEAPPYARPIFQKEPQEVKTNMPDLLENSILKLVRRARQNTFWRQKQCINLIPSEQTPSPLTRLLSIGDPCGRYAEHRHYESLGEADAYYYQGTSFIEEVEVQLQKEMANFLGCSHVETRMISGQMANAAVFSALMDYKNRVDRRSPPARLRAVMNHHLGRGGHLSSQPMGALRDFLALDPQTERPAAVNFPVLEENPYQIDLKRTQELLDRHQPELIILGKSMVLHREPLVQLREMVDVMKEKPWILYDMAHVLGLIGPHFQQPFQEGADMVTASTHKTFFGTQRGIIGSNFDQKIETKDVLNALTRRSFPGNLSNHHLGTLVGLLLSVYEMNAFADGYQRQIIQNAKAFAKALRNCGLMVEGDSQINYTETHQVLLRVGYALAPQTAQRLEANNIIVNYQALPDDEGFTASSGLRMGVQEMTRFGMKEKDFEELAGMMADLILRNVQIGEAVSRFRSRFTQMQYCLPEEKARPLIHELLPDLIG